MINRGTDGLLVSLETHGGAVVLAVSGEIDIVTAPRFRTELGVALESAPAALVIDLSGVTFLASAGLGVLVAIGLQAAPRTRIKVVAHGPITARPLALTGLTGVMAVYPTRAEALADD